MGKLFLSQFCLTSLFFSSHWSIIISSETRLATDLGGRNLPDVRHSISGVLAQSEVLCNFLRGPQFSIGLTMSSVVPTARKWCLVLRTIAGRTKRNAIISDCQRRPKMAYLWRVKMAHPTGG